MCAYTLTHDSGLAPNPFHNWCTLSLCTPNHMRAKLKPGDWIFGHSSKKDGYKIIYLMRIDEVLKGLDTYYADKRFKLKRPQNSNNPMLACGDNMYFRDVNKQWIQLNGYHKAANKVQDLQLDKKGNSRTPVFVSKHFFYFGNKAIETPVQFKSLLKKSQGIVYKSTPIVSQFINWVESNFKPGNFGSPHGGKIV